jgi:PatG Domain
MERDVQETDTPSVQETDTTRRLESTSLEGSGQPLPTSGQPAPTSPSFVYALGQVEPRFPTLAVEKEFVQGTGRTDAAGLTEDLVGPGQPLPTSPTLLGLHDRGAGDLPADPP